MTTASQPAAEQQEPAVGNGVAADDPLQVLLGEVQVALHGRERDGHDREADEVHERDQAQEGQRQLALAGREERCANDHTQAHAIRAIRQDCVPGGFWQITTASHIDWPQQARIIELFQTSTGLAIACTVIDHAASPSYRGYGDLADPAALAALSRELSANDWQSRDQITPTVGAGSGAPADRNVILPLAWPR